MINIKKGILIGILSSSIWLVSGCEEASETARKVTDEVSEAVHVEATKDNEFLLSVKGGHLYSHPEIKIEDAFVDFFSSPKWKYFEAETGEHVVEFTGYCTYMEKKVKAKLQFIVEEGNDSFEVGALEFNEVPQNNLVKAALVEAIYEGQTVTNQTNAQGTNAVIEELGTPFQTGASLNELTNYYGEPTFDDYYMGGRLVVFNNEDGYYLDEAEQVNGFYISNPNTNIFNTYVGMTPREISKILSAPSDSFFDDIETQSYVNIYYHGSYEIHYQSEEENGATTSVFIKLMGQ